MANNRISIGINPSDRNLSFVPGNGNVTLCSTNLTAGLLKNGRKVYTGKDEQGRPNIWVDEYVYHRLSKGEGNPTPVEVARAKRLFKSGDGYSVCVDYPENRMGMTEHTDANSPFPGPVYLFKQPPFKGLHACKQQKIEDPRIFPSLSQALSPETIRNLVVLGSLSSEQACYKKPESVRKGDEDEDDENDSKSGDAFFYLSNQPDKIRTLIAALTGVTPEEMPDLLKLLNSRESEKVQFPSPSPFFTEAELRPLVTQLVGIISDPLLTQERGEAFAEEQRTKSEVYQDRMFWRQIYWQIGMSTFQVLHMSVMAYLQKWWMENFQKPIIARQEALAERSLRMTQEQMDFQKRIEGGDLLPGERALEKYGRNVLDDVRAGRIMPVLGREGAIQELRVNLGKGLLANPVCTGPAGCGKTAIFEGLGIGIVGNAYPEFNPEKTALIELEMDKLNAGGSFRGQREARYKSVVDELRAIPPDQRVVVFIDEMHQANELLEMMKKYLSRPGFSVSGATTNDEHEKMIRPDPQRPNWVDQAKVDRFPVVQVPLMSADEVESLLLRNRGVYENLNLAKNGRPIAIADSAIKETIRLTSNFEKDFSPRKAINLLSLALSNAAITRTDCRELTDDIVTESFLESKKMNLAALELELQLRAEDKAAYEVHMTQTRQSALNHSLEARGIPEIERSSHAGRIETAWEALSDAERQVYISHQPAYREGTIPERFLDRVLSGRPMPLPTKGSGGSGRGGNGSGSVRKGTPQNDPPPSNGHKPPPGTTTSGSSENSPGASGPKTAASNGVQMEEAAKNIAESQAEIAEIFKLKARVASVNRTFERTRNISTILFSLFGLDLLEYGGAISPAQRELASLGLFGAFAWVDPRAVGVNFLAGPFFEVGKEAIEQLGDMTGVKVLARGSLANHISGTLGGMASMEGIIYATGGHRIWQEAFFRLIGTVGTTIEEGIVGSISSELLIAGGECVAAAAVGVAIGYAAYSIQPEDWGLNWVGGKLGDFIYREFSN